MRGGGGGGGGIRGGGRPIVFLYAVAKVFTYIE